MTQQTLLEEQAVRRRGSDMLQTRHDPASAPMSERIHRIIEEQPGLSIQEVADQVGCSRSTVRHHVQELIQADVVTTHRQGNRRLHFTAATSLRRRRAIALLRIGSIRSVVRACLASEPSDTWNHPAPLRVATLADEVGLALQTTQRSLRTLERAGLVTMQRVRRQRGTWMLSFHPELRIGWTLHGKDAGRAARPLRQAPGWFIGFGFLLQKVAFDGIGMDTA